MAGKGLYGQNQGNENRQAASSAMEHFLDNRSVEGGVVDELRHTMRHPHLWPVTTVLMEALRRVGYSDQRLQMIYGQASFGAGI